MKNGLERAQDLIARAEKVLQNPNLTEAQRAEAERTLKGVRRLAELRSPMPSEPK